MKKLVPISHSIKFLFQSIESLLNVEIDKNILSKILDDCEQDQVNKKNYSLNSAQDKIKISALVEEYEPGTICLLFENVNSKQKNIELEALFENYELAFGTGALFRSQEESIAIYQRVINHNRM